MRERFCFLLDRALYAFALCWGSTFQALHEFRSSDTFRGIFSLNLLSSRNPFLSWVKNGFEERILRSHAILLEAELEIECILRYKIITDIGIFLKVQLYVYSSLMPHSTLNSFPLYSIPANS